MLSMTAEKFTRIPGLLVAATIAALATAVPALLAYLPDPLRGLPVSPILVAILLGLALSGRARAQRNWRPGMAFAAGPLLKLAVMLIGLRLSLAQVAELGIQAVPMVIGAIGTGLLFAWGLGRLLGVGDRLTALLAVGSAICGASAVAATAPALKSPPEETAYALACVALFGLAATIIYPWLLGAWLRDPMHVGLVLGAAIHDTSQVTAAALLFEQSFGTPEVVAAATVTKLLRNLCMLIVIPAVVWWATRSAREELQRPAFPLFILGFLALAAVRTAGDRWLEGHEEWSAVLTAAAAASAYLFAVAMAAIGMAISLAALKALGMRPALVALVTALGMGVMALGVVSFLAG